jgi:hypothetical protein
MFDTELIKLVLKSARYVVALAIATTVALGIDWQWPDVLGHRAWRPTLSFVALICWSYVLVALAIAGFKKWRDAGEKRRTVDAQRRQSEQDQKVAAEAQVEVEKRVLEYIHELRSEARAWFAVLMSRPFQEFHAPYHHPSLQELREKGIIEPLPGDFDYDHHPFRVVGFVWQTFSPQREDFRKLQPRWQKAFEELQR